MGDLKLCSLDPHMMQTLQKALPQILLKFTGKCRQTQIKHFCQHRKGKLRIAEIFLHILVKLHKLPGILLLFFPVLVVFLQPVKDLLPLLQKLFRMFQGLHPAYIHIHIFQKHGIGLTRLCQCAEGQFQQSPQLLLPQIPAFLACNGQKHLLKAAKCLLIPPQIYQISHIHILFKQPVHTDIFCTPAFLFLQHPCVDSGLTVCLTQMLLSAFHLADPVTEMFMHGGLCIRDTACYSLMDPVKLLLGLSPDRENHKQLLFIKQKFHITLRKLSPKELLEGCDCDTLAVCAFPGAAML